MTEKTNENKEKEYIFNQYRHLAYNICNNYSRTNYKYMEDLEQIALTELWECIGRYKKDSGVKFITYATNCITSKVKQGILESSGVARKSSGMSFNTIIFISKNKEKEPDKILEEIKQTKWYNMSDASFYAIYNIYINKSKSINEDSEDERTEFNLKDCRVNIEKEVEEEICINQMLKKIEKHLIKKNSKRNVDIYMEWLNGIVNDEKITKQSIADEYGMSKERVRQIILKMNEKSKKIAKDWIG